MKDPEKRNQESTRRLLFFMFAFIVSFISTALAQSPATARTSTETKVKSEQWQPLFSNGSVEISYRYTACDLAVDGTKNENMYLQVRNKTAGEISCQWDTEYWYNGKCNGCEAGNAENHNTLLLKPNETIQGSCSEKSNPSLMILSKFLNMESNTELTNFNLKNIQVKGILKTNTK